MRLNLRQFKKDNIVKFRYYLLDFFFFGIIASIVAYLILGSIDKQKAVQVETTSILGESSNSTKEISRTQQIFTENHIYGLPVRLIIPKIKVDANIIHMGITSDGDMEVPSRLEDLGWYKYGPHPGEEGSAVVAGHLGVGALEFGVFKNLNLLSVGDSVIVIDDKGLLISFIVREIRVYDKEEQVKEVFSSVVGSHLNLITCTGTWIPSERTLSQRLVVFTDKAF